MFLKTLPSLAVGNKLILISRGTCWVVLGSVDHGHAPAAAQKVPTCWVVLGSVDHGHALAPAQKVPTCWVVLGPVDHGHALAPAQKV